MRKLVVQNRPDQIHSVEICATVAGFCSRSCCIQVREEVDVGVVIMFADFLSLLHKLNQRCCCIFASAEKGVECRSRLGVRLVGIVGSRLRVDDALRGGLLPNSIVR